MPVSVPTSVLVSVPTLVAVSVFGAGETAPVIAVLVTEIPLESVAIAVML